MLALSTPSFPNAKRPFINTTFSWAGWQNFWRGVQSEGGETLYLKVPENTEVRQKALRRTMETCLFTGEQLSAVTREEHTIPRGLAGRIQSRNVSCDTFNNNCGAFLDNNLKAPYAAILNKLAPLLSSEHQPGRLDVHVPGDPNSFVLEQGALTRPNLDIINRDANGIPLTAMAAIERPLHKMARQWWPENQYTISTAPASETPIFHRHDPEGSVYHEIAALKSLMLTFDHMLHDTEKRFTRQPQLKAVREFVRQAVMEKNIDDKACKKFSLGLQYDKMSLYQQLRRQIPWQASPFEHQLFVAGYTAYRCIDMVWVILGFDPVGFRVCYDWNGNDFAFGIVNGILKGESCSTAVELSPPEELLCSPTMRRACNEFPSSQTEKEDIIAEVKESIISHRQQAYKEAAYYVEMHADDWIKERIVERASCVSLDKRVVNIQFLSRLERLYGIINQTDEFIENLQSIFSQRTQCLPAAILTQQITNEDDAQNVNWSVWLEIYRNCLNDLKEIFGLPDVVFQNPTSFHLDWKSRKPDCNRA